MLKNHEEDTFPTRIKSIARFLSEDYGLQVEVVPQDGPPAVIQGDKLVFSRPSMAHIQAAGADNLKAIVYREAALALSSDRRILDTVRSIGSVEAGISEDRLSEYRQVFNALEHRRAEYDIRQSYQGLDNTVQDYDKQVLIKLLKNAKTKDDAKLEAIAKACGNSELEAMLPPEIDTKPFRDIIKRVEQAKDTKEILKLTDEFLNKFKLELTKQESESKKEEKDGDGEGEEGEEGEDKAEKQKGESSVSKAIRKRASSAPISDSKAVEMPDAPPDIKIPDDVKYFVLPEAKDGDIEENYNNSSIINYHISKREIGKEVISMSNKLKDILLLEKARRFIGGFDSGHRFDTAAVSRFVSGDDRIFKKRKKENKFDVCFTLLIDLSGSMCGEKIQSAKKTVIVLAEALNKSNIPFEVIGFTTHKGNNTEAISRAVEVIQRKEASLLSYTRCESLAHYVFKDYDKPFDMQAKARIGAMNAHRNNDDGEALLWAYTRLRKRPEVRKILMVLSDGQPAGYYNCQESHDGLLKSVCEAIEKKPDVQLFGIGYLNEAVKEYYKNTLIVSDTEDLASKLLKLLKSVIMKGRR